FALLYIAQLAAFGDWGRRMPGLFANDDDGVHPLFGDLNPRAADADVSPMVSRRIEIIWGDAVPWRGPQRRVGDLSLVAAEFDQLFERLVEYLPGRRDHPHLQLRELVVSAPELEVDHFIDRATFDHAIHDARKYLRIDQVA